MVSQCYPGFHRCISHILLDLSLPVDPWVVSNSLPQHSTGMKILVPISSLSFLIQFQDADLGFPLIILVLVDVWQGHTVWPWWGCNLSWAVFIFSKLWFWFPLLANILLYCHLSWLIISQALWLLSCFLSSLIIAVHSFQPQILAAFLSWWDGGLLSWSREDCASEKGSGAWSQTAQLRFQVLYFPATWPWAIYLIWVSFSHP